MDPKLLMKILMVTFTGGPEGKKNNSYIRWVLRYLLPLKNTLYILSPHIVCVTVIVVTINKRPATFLLQKIRLFKMHLRFVLSTAHKAKQKLPFYSR